MRIVACVSALLWATATISAEPPEEPAVDTSKPPAADAERASQSVLQTPAATDRLQLDTTVVTGNRELPKVLYIVPWKKSELGDLPAQPFNTLLDEVLTPVDRDVFRREVTYYEALSTGGAAGADAGSRSGSGSEK
jgi:hypothetical protein